MKKNITKIIAVILVFVMSVSLLADLQGVQASEEITYYTDRIFQYYLDADAGGAIISGATITEGMDLEIPSVVGGHTVKGIRGRAFVGAKISSVTIPAGVDVGNYAFDGSTISSLALPEDDITIGVGAFTLCKNLTEVTIPKEITQIRDQCFDGCEELREVHLNYGLTGIGRMAFNNCISLERVILPSSLTSIGYGVFWDCISLQKVFIPASVTSMGINDTHSWYIFDNCHPDFKIYGYAGSYAQGYANRNNIPFVPMMFPDEIPEDKYAVIVMDKTGNYLEEASVSFGEDPVLTDFTGMAIIPIESVTTNLTVTYEDAEAGVDWEYTNASYHQKESRCDTIVLGGEITSVLMAYNGISTELLTTQKTIDRKYPNTPFTITAKTSLPEPTDCEFVIFEFPGRRKVANSQTGQFNFTISQFIQGKKYEIWLYDYNNEEASGGLYKEALQLEIIDSTNVPDVSLELGSQGSVSLGDSFGGILSSISYDNPHVNIPLSCKVIEDKIILGFNLYNYDLNTGAKTNIFNYNDPGQFLQAAANARRRMETSKKTNRYSSNAIDVSAYLEGKFNSSGLSRVNGRIVLECSGKFSYKGQTVVGIAPILIPVVYEIGVSGSVGVDGSFTNISLVPLNVQSVELLAKGSIGLEISGGVGIDGAATAQLYGGGALTAEYVMLGAYPGPKKLLLDFYWGAKATLGWYEASTEFGRTTITLYNRDTAVAAPQSRLLHAGQNRSNVANLYSLDSYSAKSSSYLSERSLWLGETVNSAANTQNQQNTLPSIETLQTGSYKGIEPQLASSGSTTMLVYTDADETRNVENETVAVYSLYDTSTNTWSAPVPIENDTTADYKPVVYSDGINIWAAWLDSPTAIAAGANISAMNNFELCVAKFNRTTNSFDMPVTITSNGLYESQQCFATVNGVNYLVWTTNSSNDLFGQNSNNNILYSKYTNGAWTSPAMVATGLHTITSLAVGRLGSSPCIAATIDADCDLSTADDTDVYCFALDGSATRVTNDASDALLADGNVRFVVRNNIPLLSWCREGNIQIISSLTGQGSALLDEAYAVLPMDAVLLTSGNNATILYVKNEKNASQLYQVMYDYSTNSWGAPVALSEQDMYIRNPSVIYAGGGVMTAFNRIDAEVTSNAINETYDLCWMDVQPRFDLELTNMYMDLDTLIAGETAQLELSVTNQGNIKSDSLTVTVQDSARNTLNTQTVNQTVLPGEQEVITASFTVPATALDAITVTVSGINQTDVNTANNTADFHVNYTDLCVNAEKVVVNRSDLVMISVKNKGNVASGGTVNLTNEDGDIIYTNYIPELNKNEMALFHVNIEDTAFSDDDSWNVITASVISDQKEYYEYNNTAQVQIDKHTSQLTGISFEQSAVSVKAGRQQELTLVIDATGSTGTVPEAAWQSSDETVATVSPEGIVTGVSAGTATVTAVIGSFTASCEVTVSPQIVSVFQFNKNQYYTSASGIQVSSGELLNVQGRAYAPLRSVTESCEAEIEYHEDTKGVTLVNQSGDTYGFIIGSANYTYTKADGETGSGSFSLPTLLIGGLSYVPVRDIAVITNFNTEYIENYNSNSYVILSDIVLTTEEINTYLSIASGLITY